jgi:hypothetical protein
VVGHPDRGAAAAVFAIDAASGELLAEQSVVANEQGGGSARPPYGAWSAAWPDAQDVWVRALAAPIGTAFAPPASAGAAVPMGRWSG